MIPPFYEIFRIETKIRDLKDLNMLMINQEENSYCCVPRKYKDLAKYEMQMSLYDEELVEATQKPFVPCGHAFVVIDTIESFEQVATKFRNKPKSYFTHLKEKVKGWSSSLTSIGRNRGDNFSTLDNMQDLHVEQLKEVYKDKVLHIGKVSEPGDILWKNMSGN